MGIINENDKKTKLSYDEYRERIVTWMKGNKFTEKRIEFHSRVVDAMTDILEEGRLKILDNGELEYTLLFPLNKGDSDEEFLSKVICKNRVNFNTHVKPHMRGVKADDLAGMGLAYACGVTGLDKAVLGKLEGRDNTALSEIAGLFF